MSDLFSHSEQSQYDRLRKLGWSEASPGIWVSPGGGRFLEREALAILERHEKEQKHE